MRILLVLDTCGLIGGTERHAAALLPELAARGHEARILCRAVAGPPLVPDGGPPVHARPELAGPGLRGAARAELAALVRRLAPDAILVSAIRNADALEVLVDAAPVVRYVHDHTLFCPGGNKMTEEGEICRRAMGLVCLEQYYLRSGCTCFKRASYAGRGPLAPLLDLAAKRRELAATRRAARVLTNSRYMREQLLQVGFDPARTHVLHYFTASGTPAQPPGPLPEATAAFVAREGAPLLFTPARLALPDKGVDHLLTALGKVRSPFRAVIAGAGPAEAWLREKARAEGLGERVHFAGWLGVGAIETLYARCAVTVFPSVWDEPFGLVGLEAMAHAKPVVAFDVGGVRDWLEDGETGLLAARRDTDALAAAIDALLADPARARRMGERGRAALAARFSREAHVRGVEDALAAAAGARPAGVGGAP